MNITLGSSRIGDIFEGLIYDDKQSSRLWRREAITSRSISCQIPYEWNCCQQLPNASLSFSSSTHSITSCQCPSLWLTVLNAAKAQLTRVTLTIYILILKGAKQDKKSRCNHGVRLGIFQANSFWGNYGPSLPTFGVEVFTFNTT